MISLIDSALIGTVAISYKSNSCPHLKSSSKLLCCRTQTGSLMCLWSRIKACLAGKSPSSSRLKRLQMCLVATVRRWSWSKQRKKDLVAQVFRLVVSVLTKSDKPPICLLTHVGCDCVQPLPLSSADIGIYSTQYRTCILLWGAGSESRSGTCTHMQSAWMSFMLVTFR